MECSDWAFSEYSDALDPTRRHRLFSIAVSVYCN